MYSKSRSNRKRNVLVLLAICLIAVTTIAYAVLSQNLNINGTATLKGSGFDVHFDNVGTVGYPVTTVGTNPGTVVTSGTNLVGKSSIQMDISGVQFEYSQSKIGPITQTNDPQVQYTFDIVNDGTTDAKISAITIDAAQYFVAPTGLQSNATVLTFVGTGDNKANDEAIAASNTTYYLINNASIEPINVGDVIPAGATWHCTLGLYYQFSGGVQIPKNDVTINGAWQITFDQV